MKSFFACILVLAACQSAFADCGCDHCGCQSNCQKVCRVVCEVKKVPKVTYDCECEDFCVPGPSCRSTECDECGHRKHVYTPGCGKVRTRTKLVKHETTEEKVTYKWVVETLCCNCSKRCAAIDPSPSPLNTPGLATQIPATLAESNMAQPAGFQTPETAATGTPGEPTASEGLRFDLRRIFLPRTVAN